MSTKFQSIDRISAADLEKINQHIARLESALERKGIDQDNIKETLTVERERIFYDIEMMVSLRRKVDIDEILEKHEREANKLLSGDGRYEVLYTFSVPGFLKNLWSNITSSSKEEEQTEKDGSGSISEQDATTTTQEVADRQVSTSSKSEEYRHRIEDKNKQKQLEKPSDALNRPIISAPYAPSEEAQKDFYNRLVEVRIDRNQSASYFAYFAPFRKFRKLLILLFALSLAATFYLGVVAPSYANEIQQYFIYPYDEYFFYLNLYELLNLSIAILGSLIVFFEIVAAFIRFSRRRKTKKVLSKLKILKSAGPIPIGEVYSSPPTMTQEEYIQSLELLVDKDILNLRRI